MKNSLFITLKSLVKNIEWFRERESYNIVVLVEEDSDLDDAKNIITELGISSKVEGIYKRPNDQVIPFLVDNVTKLHKYELNSVVTFFNGNTQTVGTIIAHKYKNSGKGWINFYEIETDRMTYENIMEDKISARYKQI